MTIRRRMRASLQPASWSEIIVFSIQPMKAR